LKRLAAHTLVAIQVLSGTALAQAPTTPAAAKPAASAPTTRLATTRLIGEDNPKRLLTLYAAAMAAGHVEAVKNSYWAETPEEKRVVEAYGHLASSVAALRKAATDKFGPDGFDNIGFAKMFADQIKVLEQTRLFVDGPKAFAFTDKDDRPDLRLVRVEAGWRISATSFSNPVRTAARIEAQAGAYDELAAEIAADKYPLATDARVAGRAKVQAAMQAVDERLKSATRPAAPAATTGK
jgi:hypothetical protein